MTYEEIRARMAAEYETLAGFAPDDAADAGIRIRVLAGEIYTALCALEAVKADAFPQTAAGEALELHALERGLTRRPAVQAAGTLVFSRDTALTYDVDIPAGTVCASSTGAAEFETVADAVLAAGVLSVSVPARAVVGGKACNAAAGAVDTLVTPPAGIERVTNPQAFSGGTDAESDSALRARLLQSWSIQPNGTNAETYRRAVQQVAGVGSVNVVPRANGSGTVAVYVYGDGVPVEAETIEAVRRVLEALREINVDVTVAAAEPVQRVVTAYITPKDGVALEEAQALCTDAVRAYFNTLTVGAPFVKAAVVTAIMNTDAVENCVLPDSMSDYSTPADRIVTCGAVNILERQI